MDHLANHSAEETGLARSDLTYDDNELTLLHLQVNVLDVEDVVEGTSRDGNVVLLFSGGNNFSHPFFQSSLRLVKSLFLLLLGLLLELILLLLILCANSPAKAALNCESVFVVASWSRYLVNKTLLDFG